MYAFESKHKGIMESMGLESLILDPTQPPEQIIDFLKMHEEKRQFFIDLVQSKREELAKKATEPYQYISKFLDKT